MARLHHGHCLDEREPDHVNISARGRVFQLYNKHFGSIPVGIGSSSPQPRRSTRQVAIPAKGQHRQLTYPLDVVAALTRRQQDP